jgi:antitoxin VapB
MATTRVFKAGNSQAVRIPKALAFANDIAEVEIERRGNSLVITPQKPSMAELIEKLRSNASGLPRRERPPIDWPIRSFDPDYER